VVQGLQAESTGRVGSGVDLDEDDRLLLPLCAHHHTKVHDADCNLRLGPNREFTISFPDGTIHNTGPPDRRAA
jgi:hypothetical protein